VYRRARSIAAEREVTSDADLGPLLAAPASDAGDAAAYTVLRHMFETGGWVLLESTLADLPADLRWLFESGAVTLEQLAALHKAVGAATAADLHAALRDHRIRTLPQGGALVEEAIDAALPSLRAAMHRIPLGRATAVAEPLLARLRAMTGVAWAEPVGSLRRGQDLVGDVEIVAPAANAAAVLDDVFAATNAARWLHRSERRLYFLEERIQVGIRVPPPERAAAALVYLTGSMAHVDGLRRRAAALGLRLTIDGLYANDGSLVPTAHEADIYNRLGLEFVAPEIRSGDGEIDLAARRGLPPLVDRRDIRGDLHMHSTWSDGRDSIEAMAAACRALGYEYMAITDHSPHSASSRNLTLDGVKRQADEIAEVRQRVPGITILHGCEADILQDGRIDFPDRILERFDIVLASLHDAGDHSPAQLMRRYEEAMRHPLVAAITHPTNRLVPHRAGYDLDYDRLFELAAATNTLVEVDGAPSHLDLDGALARRAVAAGATLVVDSDCHRADLLDRQMRLGVTTARRGWVEPRHVVNTRSIAEVRAFIARKREGR